MALVATPGSSTADSYVTLSEANTMAASVGLATWATKTDAEKEAALRKAAQEIDAHRFHDQEEWQDGQALIFPRKKDEGEIPAAVKWAQVYQADYLAASGEADQGRWEGPKAGPMKDAGTGSPLTSRAFQRLAKFISRTGKYAG